MEIIETSQHPELHVSEPVTCSENKHVIHIATKTDEFKLLSSLHTLGYIEFDVLCNLDCLQESLFKYANLSCFGPPPRGLKPN